MNIQTIVKTFFLTLMGALSLISTAAYAEYPAPSVKVQNKYDIAISWPRRRFAEEYTLYQNGVLIQEIDGSATGTILYNLSPGTYQYFFELCYEESTHDNSCDEEGDCDEEEEETFCENSYPTNVAVFANQAPTMTMTTKNGGRYSHTNSITLVANASDSDGSVSSVRFYKNNVDQGLATRSGSTYSKTLSPQTPGTYTIIAVATDDEGLTREASVNIVVFQSPAAFTDTVTYQHTDMLGSPVAETNASGSVTSRSHYSPFGKRLEGNKEGIGYTGHLEDVNLGLTYMQARYYDPMIGRFYSNDPVGFLEHLNRNNAEHGFGRYTYANNNPIQYTDPDGEFATLPLAVFGAVVGAVAGGTAAALNGGGIKEIAGSVAAGALVGGITGLTAGAAAAGSTLTVSSFAAASATGAVASGSGEAIGQLATNGGDISKVDGTKVGVAAIAGAASGQAGAIAQAVTGSAKTAIKIGAAVDVMLSPGVANAEGSQESTQED